MSKRKYPSPPVKRSNPPPFLEMDEYDFQRLLSEVIQEETGIDDAHVFGERGNPQYGIDIEALSGGKTHTVIQAKREKQFGAAKIVTSAQEFLQNIKYWKSKGTKRYILAVARPLETIKQRKAIDACRIDFQKYGIEYIDWDNHKITSKISPHERIVSRFLGPEWVERLCGKRLPPQNYTDLGDRNNPNLVPLIAIKSNVSHTIKLQKGKIVKLLAHGNNVAALKVISDFRQSDNWSVCSPEDKAGVIRLQANIHLMLPDGQDEALDCLEQAKKCDGSETPIFFEALVNARKGEINKAASLLKGAQSIEEKILLSEIFLSQEKFEEANTKIINLKPETDDQVSSIQRIKCILAFADGDLDEASKSLDKELERDPLNLSLRFHQARLLYFRVVSPIERPKQLPDIPQPIEWIFVKDDQKSIQSLSEALDIFRSLQDVTGISEIEKQNFLYWELACLCLNRSKGEEALEFCAELLVRHKTDAIGIAWGVSRGLIEENQLKRSKKILQNLIYKGKATSSNILSLCGLLISIGERVKAGEVIFAAKELFESEERIQLWRVWCLQCGVQELQNKDLSTIKISEQKMLKLYSSEGTQEVQTVIDTLEAAKKDKHWYEFTVSIQLLNTQNQHQIIAQNAKTLVEEVGTRQALELAVNSCYQVRRFNDALNFLEGYEDKDLSAFLRRIKIYCLESMGKDHEAITLAAMTAQISGHVNDELSLASLHLRLRGDIPAATVILKKQIPFGGIEAKQAIEFAQGLANFDPDLAIDLLRIAHKQGIHEDHLTEAFMLSHSLGEEEINKSIALELFPKISSGKIKSAQMINIDDFMEITKKNQEDQERCWKLYLACQIPIHLLERLNINFDNFFRLCNINADNQQHIQLKSIIYGRFGGRLFIEKFTEAAKEWNLFLDISSLFLAYDLDILDKCIETFGAIHIPENIPLLLLNMGGNIPDPTPLRTDAAREFLKMISNGNIREIVDEPNKYQQVAYVGNNSVGEEDIYFGDMLQKLYDEELISETELTRIQSLKGDDWSTTTGRLKDCQSRPIIFLIHRVTEIPNISLTF